MDGGYTWKDVSADPVLSQPFQPLIDPEIQPGTDLMKAITWLRFVPDIRALHEAADILVLCSDREGLGRCVVEAMAMELPVVVTDCGGSHELIGNEERGFRVRGGDPNDLADKMIEALTNETLSRKMAHAARMFAETRLNARISARKILVAGDRLSISAVIRHNAAAVRRAWQVCEST